MSDYTHHFKHICDFLEKIEAQLERIADALEE